MRELLRAVVHYIDHYAELRRQQARRIEQEIEKDGGLLG